MNTTMKKQIIEELDSLSDNQAADFLHYIRFLKWQEKQHSQNEENTENGEKIEDDKG